MIKIPTIFKRDYSHTYRVLNEPNPECAWVFENQSEVYRKWQGMAAMLLDGEYYKRVVIKPNQVTPTDFILCTLDKRSGKQFGWLPVNFELPQDQYYVEAFDSALPEGTYELIGPKIHGNPENIDQHVLVSHTVWKIYLLRVTYKDIKTFLSLHTYEGLVFHHSDGRMAKIKKKDFGMVR